MTSNHAHAQQAMNRVSGMDGPDAPDGPRGPATGDPGPVGDTALTQVLHELDDEGADGQFVAKEGGDIQCLTCRHTFPASSQRADRMRRLEGASDPADMVMVVPLRCPACGTSGSLTAHYGPEASEAEADVLVALERTPSQSSPAGLPES